MDKNSAGDQDVEKNKMQRKRKIKSELEESTVKKPYSPAYLGATQELNILSFANSRALEIKELKETVLQHKSHNKPAAQRLPPHMRRRAMSHNIKRLPRNLQQFAAKMYENQKGLVRKRPSRYHRRRPGNLLKEYQRRNRKHVWLETHIWHAKRFHMVEKWGYKLAWKPTDKSHRAAYRATKDHCLLQDMSYMCCLELSGKESHLIENLSHLTSTETGPTFASKACLNGTREGFTVLYEADQYPWRAIGPVNFMWKPVIYTSSKQQAMSKTSTQSSYQIRTMWIWCHPCIFESVWRELGKCLELKERSIESQKEKYENDVDNSDEKFGVNNGEDKQQTFKPCIIDKYKTDILYENQEKSATLKSLPGSILRFRLNGPQSNSILADLLRQANIIPVQKEETDTDPWWKPYYAREETSLSHSSQREFLENILQCQSPAELSPHCILATTVQDPRLGRPNKRTKLYGSDDYISSDVSYCRLKVTPDLSSSPLWDEKIREEVTQTKQPDYKMAELKSELLIPGSRLDLGDEESKIPVIIIQRPGVPVQGSTEHDPCPGRGSGWDLLLPKGWGMSFWLGLVFRGARCNGLLEQECSVYEDRSLLFPHNYPDTQAALEHYSEVEDTLLAKYNRTPPAKRPNFTKNGVPFPFNYPWNLLIEYWACEKKTKDGNENILRGVVEIKEEDNDNTTANIKSTHLKDDQTKCDSTSTEKLEKQVTNMNKPTDRKYFVLRNHMILRKLSAESTGVKVYNGRSNDRKIGTGLSVLDIIEQSYKMALIPVRVEILSRGLVSQYSTICIPLAKDIRAIKTSKSFGGPLEPKHIDPKLSLKKKLKREMKEKKMNKKVKVDRTLRKMVACDNLSMDTCSRKVLGFICQGGFSMGTGTGVGVGFVSGAGLSHFVKNSVLVDQKWIVLVRNNTSLQYRAARMSVIV